LTTAMMQLRGAAGSGPDRVGYHRYRILNTELPGAPLPPRRARITSSRRTAAMRAACRRLRPKVPRAAPQGVAGPAKLCPHRLTAVVSRLIQVASSTSPFRVVDRVHPAGVRVPPEPLDRRAHLQRPPAGVLEQQVHRLDVLGLLGALPEHREEFGDPGYYLLVEPCLINPCLNKPRLRKLCHMPRLEHVLVLRYGSGSDHRRGRAAGQCASRPTGPVRWPAATRCRAHP